MENARLVKETFHYRANQDLINVGAYRLGTDPKIDFDSEPDDYTDFVRQHQWSCSFPRVLPCLALQLAMTVAGDEPGTYRRPSTARAATMVAHG